MKKEIEQDRNVILSYIEPSKEPIEQLEMANLKVINYIEELEEEAELQLNKARHYFKKLKRIEKVYEQDINTPMPSDKLEELKCIKSYFQIKSILEEGVDQDENN